MRGVMAVRKSNPASPLPSSSPSPSSFSSGSSKRDAVFWKILNAALELDSRRGHLKWTMSDLSRKSEITRSLIYYHFGRSKMAILDEAVRMIGQEIIGIGPERMALWRNGEWAAAIRAARAITSQSSCLVTFYLVHRERPTDIGNSLRGMEKAYLKKLETIFPGLPPAGIRALFALFFGAIFGPLVDEAAIEFAANTVKSLMGTLNEGSR